MRYILAEQVLEAILAGDSVDVDDVHKALANLSAASDSALEEENIHEAVDAAGRWRLLRTAMLKVCTQAAEVLAAQVAWDKAFDSEDEAPDYDRLHDGIKALEPLLKDVDDNVLVRT